MSEMQLCSTKNNNKLHKNSCDAVNIVAQNPNPTNQQAEAPTPNKPTNSNTDFFRAANRQRFLATSPFLNSSNTTYNQSYNSTSSGNYESGQTGGGTNAFGSWIAKNASKPVVDLNITYIEGYGAKLGVELLGMKLRGGIHFATLEYTYNVATGYSSKAYSGLELGIGIIELSALYVGGKGFQFDYSISTFNNLNTNPMFNIFGIEAYIGVGGKVELNINLAKYMQSLDPSIDLRYLYLYK